ncbi:restriction endonuclease subunit S [Haemophilus influenzae]|uniref:restriction endonuclease subunit S n=1 Tax=Haemophilus influenzae TaxID=727 RepID=UPI001F26F821|nr:restriction endonuclease subunit S [Haemophilus influenzae]MCK9061719.1 restriction endonuclease subunit S [Haemophilus influenzae]MCK9079676.1 restriction endonuclease subunit S [Haemophilus influenzae]MCK9118560.1 restriction endonuclease subunit S [Haemophilus influenzae]
MKLKSIFNEIADVVMGQSPSGEDVTNSICGLPLLNGPSEFTSFHPIPVQYTEKGKKFANPNDILFCVRGSTTGKMNIADQKYAIGRGLAAIKGKNGYSTKYVQLILEQNLDRLLTMATGSTFPNVSRDLLLNFEVDILPVTQANEISNIFNKIDQKIQLNTQINQTLEQIAQALFKSWFVDFDPVRAKVQALSDGLSLEQAELAAMQAISGKTPEELTALSQTQPDRYAELAETAKAFPCEMVEIDGVEVPKGWECFSLKELSSVVSKGTTPKKSSLSSCDSKETVPFIKVKDISESGQILINQVEQIPEKISSTELKRSILHKNDILISIAGTIGRVAIVPNELENANTNQAISFIRLYNDNLVGIISTFLKSRKNQKDILSKVIQGVQANISLEVVRNIKIFLPINFDHKAILIFNSLLNKQLINQKENLLTEKSRDLLLPQLLSGEIDEK